MKRTRKIKPLEPFHRAVSQLISLPMGPLLAVVLGTLAALGLQGAAQQSGGGMEISMALVYVFGTALAAWAALACLHTVHGMIFLRWQGEVLEGSRWRTPAGAVGLYQGSFAEGIYTLAFESGVIAGYGRDTLDRVQ